MPVAETLSRLEGIATDVEEFNLVLDENDDVASSTPHRLRIWADPPDTTGVEIARIEYSGTTASLQSFAAVRDLGAIGQSWSNTYTRNVQGGTGEKLNITRQDGSVWVTLSSGTGNTAIGIQTQFNDDVQLDFGSSGGSDSLVKWSAAAQTNDGVIWALGVGSATTSGNFTFTAFVNRNTNHAYTVSADPRLYLASTTTPATNFWSIHHDGLDANMIVGAGSLTVDTDFVVTGDGASSPDVNQIRLRQNAGISHVESIFPGNNFLPLRVSGSTISLQTGNLALTERYLITSAITGVVAHSFTQFVNTSGTPTLVSMTGAAHTSLTNANFTGILLDLSANVEFTGGVAQNFARASAVEILAPSFFAAATGLSVDDAATLYISGAPVDGDAEITLTRTYALWVDSGSVRFDDGAEIRDLTSGRVTFATTSGRLTDSANYLFDGTSVWTFGDDAIATTFNAPGDVWVFDVDSNANTAGTPNYQWQISTVEAMRLTDGGTLTITGTTHLLTLGSTPTFDALNGQTGRITLTSNNNVGRIVGGNGATADWDILNAGSVLFRTLAAIGLEFHTNTLLRWQITSGGELVPFATNARDIGTTAIAVDTVFTRITRADTGFGYTIQRQDGTPWVQLSAGTTESAISINTRWNDDILLLFGTVNDSNIRWSTVQTNDGMLFATGVNSAAQSGNFIFTASAADHAYAVSADPRVYIASTTTPATNFISFHHDATNGRIITGAGGLTLASATGVINVASSGALRTGNVGDVYFLDLGDVSFRDGNGGSSGVIVTIFGDIGTATNPVTRTHTNAIRPGTATVLIIEEAGGAAALTIATGGVVNANVGLEVSDLTSSRVTFATTNGRLTDNAGLTYVSASDRLTLTGVSAGVPAVIKIENTDNTLAGSHARLEITTGGPSGGDGYIFYTHTGITNWSVGFDNTDNDFKISQGSPGTLERFTVAITTGTVTIAEELNVGTTVLAVAQGDFAAGLTGAGEVFYDNSTRLLDVRSNSTSTVKITSTTSTSTHEIKLIINSPVAGGDPFIRFDIADAATASMSLGLDNSDSDNFKISSGTTLPSNTRFTIVQATGATEIAQWLNIGTTTLAVAQGDWATGLTGAGQAFFDASLTRFELRDGSGGTFTIFDARTAGNTALEIRQPVNTSGEPQILFLQGGAHTTTLTDTEILDIEIDLNRIIEITASGPSATLAQHRSIVIQAPTIAANIPTLAITEAATVVIVAAPTAGANVTITSPYAFWVQAGRTQLDGNVTVGGSLTTQITNTQVVFSNSGVLTGDAGFTYASGTDTFTVTQASAGTGGYVLTGAGGTFTITQTSGGLVTMTTSGSDSIRFQTNGTSRWEVNNSGPFIPLVNNTLDIGTFSLAARRTFTNNLRAGTTTALTIERQDGTSWATLDSGTGATSINIQTNFNAGPKIVDNVQFLIGSSNDSTMAWSTVQTNDGVIWSVTAGATETSGNIVITEFANRGLDHAYAISADPKLIIASTTTPATDRIEFSHTGANAFVDAFGGILTLRTSNADTLLFQTAATSRMSLSASTATLTVGIGGAGAIQAGSTRVLDLGADGTSFWRIQTSGNLTPATTNTQEFGSGVLAMSTIYTRIIRADNGNDFTIAPNAETTGTPTGLTYTGAGHTNLTGEAIDGNFDASRTVTLAAASAPALWRVFNFEPPAIQSISGQTIARAATVYISGFPSGGGAGPLTITNSYALLVATGNVLFNDDASAVSDFRVEGGSLTHMLFLDASVATENVVLLAASAPGFNSMDRGVFIGDNTTEPTGNPTAGGYLWSRAGALKWRGSSGTITTIAAAEPHCPKCGMDYVHEWRNSSYTLRHLAVCVPCMIGALDKAGIDRNDYTFGRAA